MVILTTSRKFNHQIFKDSFNKCVFGNNYRKKLHFLNYYRSIKITTKRNYNCSLYGVDQVRFSVYLRDIDWHPRIL